MEGNPWGDGKVWVCAPVVWDGRGCRDEGDQGRCQLPVGRQDKGFGRGSGFVEATTGWDREPVVLRGSLVQVPTVPPNLFTAMGKSLNHSEPVHSA